MSGKSYRQQVARPTPLSPLSPNAKPLRKTDAKLSGSRDEGRDELVAMVRGANGWYTEQGLPPAFPELTESTSLSALEVDLRDELLKARIDACGWANRVSDADSPQRESSQCDATGRDSGGNAHAATPPKRPVWRWQELLGMVKLATGIGLRDDGHEDAVPADSPKSSVEADIEHLQTLCRRCAYLEANDALKQLRAKMNAGEQDAPQRQHANELRLRLEEVSLRQRRACIGTCWNGMPPLPRLPLTTRRTRRS